MRTDAEIVARIKAVTPSDWMGTQRGDLIATLSYALAKEWLKDGVTEAEWNEDVVGRDREAVIARMRDYMSFAWEKALGERGISASRSIDHFRTWVWLLEDDEALAFLDDDGNYKNYGRPMLFYLCKRYGFETPGIEEFV